MEKQREWLLVVKTRAAKVSALARGGFSGEREFGSDLPSGPDFVRLVSGDASIALEIQFAKTEFQHEVVRRAGEGGRRPCAATPEDLIIMKVIANGPKKHERSARADWPPRH